jgi:peptidoglycan/LPS O-acetylase OafA/YrhL
MQFYVVFMLLIIDRRVGLAAMAVWFSLSIVSLFLPDEPSLFSIYFAPIHLLFAMGIATAVAYRRFEGRHAELCAVIGVGLFMAFAYIELAAPPETTLQLAQFLSLPYGVASALIIYGFTGSERKYSLAAPGLLILLGDASYVSYLTHQPFIVLAAKVAAATGAKSLLSPSAWYWIIASAAIAFATGFHILVERPILNASNKALSRRPRETLTIPLSR